MELTQLDLFNDGVRLKKCKHCPNLFVVSKYHTVYCSSDCARFGLSERKKKWHQKNMKKAIDSELSPSTKGAIGEYRVCNDLLQKGFEVFRAASPNSSCDLVAMKYPSMLRVEVKLVMQSSSGNLAIPSHNPEKYDLLALVTSDKIVYRPEIAA